MYIKNSDQPENCLVLQSRQMLGSNLSRLTLTQTAVTHFSPQDKLTVDIHADYDYEYVLDCRPTAQGGPLAIALSTLKVQLRNRETLAMQHEFHAHNTRINEIWASDVTPWMIATCSSDETMKVWDLRSKLPALVIPVKQEVWSMSIGCGDSLIVAGTDEKAHFFDIRTGQKLGEYGESHVDAVTKVRFHPVEQACVVTASEDGIVCLFDCRIPNEDEAILSVLNVESAISNIGFVGTKLENIFCLTGTETLDVWNLEDAERCLHMENVRKDIHEQLGWKTDYLIDCIQGEHDNEIVLFSGNHDGHLRIMNVNYNGQIEALLNQKVGHNACIRCVYYDHRSATLVSGGEDSRLCQWKVPLSGFSPINNSNKSLDNINRRQKSKIRQSINPY